MSPSSRKQKQATAVGLKSYKVTVIVLLGHTCIQSSLHEVLQKSDNMTAIEVTFKRQLEWRKERKNLSVLFTLIKVQLLRNSRQHYMVQLYLFPHQVFLEGV